MPESSSGEFTNVCLDTVEALPEDDEARRRGHRVF